MYNLGCAWPSEAAKAATVAFAVAEALMSGEPSTWNHHALDDSDDVDNNDDDCEDEVDDTMTMLITTMAMVLMMMLKTSHKPQTKFCWGWFRKLYPQEDHLHGFVDMLVYFSNCIQKLRLQNLWKKLFHNDVFSNVKSAVSCFHHFHYCYIQIQRSSAAWLVSLAFGSWISSKIIKTNIIIIHFNIITIMIIITLWSAASLVAGTSPQYLLLCSLESYHF